MLDEVLSARVSRGHPRKGRSANKSVFVSSLWHGAFHAISEPLRAAFSHPSAVQELYQGNVPADIQKDLRPLLAYQYSPPMGVLWSNATRLATSKSGT